MDLMQTEFRSGYISDDEEDRFKRLVLKDIKGKCAPEELAILESDRKLWLDELTLVVQDLQAQLSARKAEGLKRRPKYDEFKTINDAWMEWKGRAVHFQTRALDRRRDVQTVLKAENRANPENNLMFSVLSDMLVELRAIRTALEA
jgi:hypothetical protein